jgi:AAHS family 4-hydroxybenzoate transporter-like MFS transporter
MVSVYQTHIDVAMEISRAELQPVHFKALFLIALITIFDGYNTVTPAYTIHFLVHPWNIPKSQIGLLMSSGLFGFLFGSLASGPIADRIGRRSSLIGALYVSGIFSIVTGFVNSAQYFNLFRFFTGLGLGVLMPLGVAYINELAPKRIENIFAFVGTMGIALGGIIAALLGAYLTPEFGWRVLYFIGGIATIVGVLSQFFLDESPRYMALNQPKYREELAAFMVKLNPKMEASYNTADFFINDAEGVTRGSVLLLLKQNTINTILIWITSFFLLFEIYSLAGWLPTVMASRGFNLAQSDTFGALSQFGGLIGGLLSAYVADTKIGRRKTFCVMMIVAVLDGIMFNYLPPERALDFFLAFILGFCIIGGMFVLNNFTAQNYDTNIRATGTGMQLGVGRVGGVLGPYIFGVISVYSSVGNIFFYMISVVAFLMSGLILFARSELAHRSENV